MKSMINYIIAFLIGYLLSKVYDKIQEGKFIPSISTEMAIGLSIIGIIIVVISIAIF